MKKNTQIVTTACIAVLLFSFGMTNAQTVHFDDLIRPTKATSITNLTVSGTTYDVEFVTGQDATAAWAYGDYPGVYTFINETSAGIAIDAMNVELTAAGALSVGIPFSIEYLTYRLGFEGYLVGPTNIEYCRASVAAIGATDIWGRISTEGSIYNVDGHTWARFSPVLGVNDALFGDAISVFPNPAENYINIKSEVFIQSIYMSDVTGKRMQNLPFEAGETSATLDVSSFSPGLYFLKLEDDKGQVSIKKIIIQ